MSTITSFQRDIYMTLIYAWTKYRTYKRLWFKYPLIQITITIGKNMLSMLLNHFSLVIMKGLQNVCLYGTI